MQWPSPAKLLLLCRPFHLPPAGLAAAGVPSDPAPTAFVPQAGYHLLMEAFGGRGVEASTAVELQAALRQALASRRPTLINVSIDPQAGVESGNVSRAERALRSNARGQRAALASQQPRGEALLMLASVPSSPAPVCHRPCRCTPSTLPRHPPRAEPSQAKARPRRGGGPWRTAVFGVLPFLMWVGEDCLFPSAPPKAVCWSLLLLSSQNLKSTRCFTCFIARLSLSIQLPY